MADSREDSTCCLLISCVCPAFQMTRSLYVRMLYHNAVKVVPLPVPFATVTHMEWPVEWVVVAVVAWREAKVGNKEPDDH